MWRSLRRAEDVFGLLGRRAQHPEGQFLVSRTLEIRFPTVVAVVATAVVDNSSRKRAVRRFRVRRALRGAHFAVEVHNEHVLRELIGRLCLPMSRKSAH
eukprot:4944002-Pyramimonas_sp.AAC.1